MNPDIARRRHAKAEAARHQHECRKHDHSGHDKINVGEFERQLSLVGGTVLALCGLMRGSLSGLGLAAVGGALMWRGYTGHCEMYHMLGHSSAEESDHDDGHSHRPAPAQYDPQLHG